MLIQPAVMISFRNFFMTADAKSLGVTVSLTKTLFMSVMKL